MTDLESIWMEKFPEKRKPFLMSHRGNRALFPENTLPAFRQAVKDGADILETDLHLSKDGVFMCIHDATVDRTMNGSGEVSEMTLAELKSLRALDDVPRATDESIPVLDELVDFLPKNVALALELKTDRFLEEDICIQLRDLLSKHQVLDRTFVLSFSIQRLKAVKKFTSEIPIGWISMTRLLPNIKADLIGSFWPAFYINPFYVKMAHHNGLLTCPLDPTPDKRLSHYLKMGVDAVLSDDSGTTRKALDRLIAQDQK